MEIGDFPMMRKLMLGIRQRAESLARTGSNKDRGNSGNRER
jgi:hypothetical protein